MKTIIWRTILLLAAFFLVLNVLSGFTMEKANVSEITQNSPKENTEDIRLPTGDLILKLKASGITVVFCACMLLLLNHRKYV